MIKRQARLSRYAPDNTGVFEFLLSLGKGQMGYKWTKHKEKALVFNLYNYEDSKAFSVSKDKFNEIRDELSQLNTEIFTEYFNLGANVNFPPELPFVSDPSPGTTQSPTYPNYPNGTETTVTF
jgi:hypothetical protein